MSPAVIHWIGGETVMILGMGRRWGVGRSYEGDDERET